MNFDFEVCEGISKIKKNRRNFFFGFPNYSLKKTTNFLRISGLDQYLLKKEMKLRSRKSKPSEILQGV